MDLKCSGELSRFPFQREFQFSELAIVIIENALYDGENHIENALSFIKVHVYVFIAIKPVLIS